jgi:hypothetical protein
VSRLQSFDAKVIGFISSTVCHVPFLELGYPIRTQVDRAEPHDHDWDDVSDHFIHAVRLLHAHIGRGGMLPSGCNRLVFIDMADLYL